MKNVKNYLYRKFSIEINRALVLSKKKFRIWVPPLHYIYWIIKNEFILFYSILVTSISASYPQITLEVSLEFIYILKNKCYYRCCRPIFPKFFIFSIFCSFFLLLEKHIAWGKYFFFFFQFLIFSLNNNIYIYIYIYPF